MKKVENFSLGTISTQVQSNHRAWVQWVVVNASKQEIDDIMSSTELPAGTEWFLEDSTPEPSRSTSFKHTPGKGQEIFVCLKKSKFDGVYRLEPIGYKGSAAFSKEEDANAFCKHNSGTVIYDEGVAFEISYYVIKMTVQ